MDEMVILVDRQDRQTGVEEKLKAHREGKLHRAFSVFVFNEKGEMLLQKRARYKYHSGGLWTNACCSHPRPGEAVEQAARRRLQEEMGFECDLKEAFHFIYKARLDGGLVEHEFDHVLVGGFEGEPEPDPAEVGAWRWLSPETALAECSARAAHFTPWFARAFRLALGDAPR